MAAGPKVSWRLETPRVKAVKQEEGILRAMAKTDKELERLREFATWVVNLERVEFIEERRTVTLTKIIDRAAKALGHTEEQPSDS